MPSSTIEDYLKAIYAEQLARPGERVTTGRIADALSVTPGTATSMMKTLANAGLVTYEPYGGVMLTDAGEALAMRVLRRHRIVELFLVEVLGMDWSEVHPEAERLEHVVSEKMLERMDALLGRPTFDPHGDPIPTARGDVASTDHPSLLTCGPGRHRVARVLDQSADFLRRLDRCGVVPGEVATVGTRGDDGPVVVETASGRHAFDRAAAAQVLVEPVQDPATRS